MEIFLYHRIIHTRNAKQLRSYPQRVMSNTKNSDHSTHSEYTSTHPTPSQSPIENVHPAPIHPKYTSTYLCPVKQTKKQAKKCPSLPTKTIPLFNITHLSQPQKMSIHSLTYLESQSESHYKIDRQIVEEQLDV